MTDNVDHPQHYNAHPSNVEAIDIVEHLSFNLGNAIKYLWRRDHKGRDNEDTRKALWYLERELERLHHTTSESPMPPAMFRFIDRVLASERGTPLAAVLNSLTHCPVSGDPYEMLPSIEFMVATVREEIRRMAMVGAQ